MGQRLIIKNNFNSTTRSVIYYHWSAYTFEAIEVIKQLVSDVFWAMKVQSSELPNLSLEQHLDLACLKAVSGIPEHSKSSIDYINSLLPEPFDNSNVNRNDGLIALGYARPYVSLTEDSDQRITFYLSQLDTDDYTKLKQQVEVNRSKHFDDRTTQAIHEQLISTLSPRQRSWFFFVRY